MEHKSSTDQTVSSQSSDYLNHLNLGKHSEGEGGKTEKKNSHLMDDPVRHVSLDFVLASASGIGFSFLVMRTSQTRMIPSDDADATMCWLSSASPSLFLYKTTMPFTRVECASSMLYATFPLVMSQALILRSSPPVNKIPCCKISLSASRSKSKNWRKKAVAFN